MNISKRHSNTNFAHSFGSYCLTNFWKSIQLSLMVSLWCEVFFFFFFYVTFNLHDEKTSMDTNMVKKKIELECRLLIYSNSTLKSLVKMRNLNMLNAGHIRTYIEEKKNQNKTKQTNKQPNKQTNKQRSLKYLHTFAILHFSYENTLIKLSFTVLKSFTSIDK